MINHESYRFGSIQNKQRGTMRHRKLVPYLPLRKPLRMRIHDSYIPSLDLTCPASCGWSFRLSSSSNPAPAHDHPLADVQNGGKRQSGWTCKCFSFVCPTIHSFWAPRQLAKRCTTTLNSNITLLTVDNIRIIQLPEYCNAKADAFLRQGGRQLVGPR